MADSTLVGWTGRGSLDDLEATATRILKIEGMRPSGRKAGSSLLFEGGRPTDVANLLAFLPGVSWVAVGRSSRNLDALFEEISRLAKTYLRKGRSFAVSAEASARTTPTGDLVGRANSTVLDAVRGARVDEQAPSVRFRLAFDGKTGAAGVELKKGPGGVPTGNRRAICLVSGGMHSSVMAWLALLSGLQLELVHARVDDESMREVALLFSELSHRADPELLSLRVLEGGPVGGTLLSWVKKADGEVFTGIHLGCSRATPSMFPVRVRSPLYILPEEEFERILGTLSLRNHAVRDGWDRKLRDRRIRERTFGGKRTDMHGVLDGLR